MEALPLLVLGHAFAVHIHCALPSHKVAAAAHTSQGASDLHIS
jgi:hypothetical protein